MPIDSKRVQAIFLAAVEQADRAAILDRECGNDLELRRRVEALLKANDEPASYLDQPAVELGKPVGTVDYAPISEKPGSMIGPYKLKEQIGEGGFGLVFVAEQQEPVKRKVALKVIKPGMDTREVMARFTAERQALALMDHPNIARVLDAGATESGRPYFVMELVRGIPITDYCDQNQLSPRDRLDLFITVCQAVQHAHQKGIIHRDIKPSNVLVTSHDGKPVAKVIDFGVAKAIHQQLTERSIYTNFAQMIGTPLYMSPEQAEMSGLDIDTRSDIYSLGVLLYELLTGTTPFDKQRFAKAAYDEIRRMIREEEPPKPSTRLSQSGESLPSVAAQRKMEPAKLSKFMCGDLDWITMKALEKDRTRRYETANGLARDIRRFLSDEPVEACPPSTTYRLRKFARKNRAALTTAAAIALFLVAGAAVSTWQAVRATRAETVALAAREAEAERSEGERVAKLKAEANEKLASERLVQVDAEKKKAEEEKQIAQAVQYFLQSKLLDQADVAKQADALLKAGGLAAEAKENPTIRELLDRAAKELTPDKVDANFPNQPLVQAAILQTVGATYRGVGEYDRAIGLLQRAVALRRRHLGHDHPDTLSSMNSLGVAYDHAGKLDLAVPLQEETLKLTKAKLGPEHPSTLNHMNNLAVAYYYAEKLDLAVPLHEETLKLRKATVGPDHPDTHSSMNNLAQAYLAAGKWELAMPLHQETLKFRKAKLGLDHPNTLFTMDNLAQAYEAAGKLDLALPLFEEALKLRKAKLGPDHPNTLSSMNSLAMAYRAAGKRDLSLPLFEETHKLRKAKLGLEHRDTLRSMNDLATAYEDAGKLDLAITLRNELLGISRTKLGPEHPDTLTNMHDLAVAYKVSGAHDQALSLLKEAYPRAKKHPTLSLIGAHLLGSYMRAGKTEDAAALATELLADARTQLPKDSLELARQLAAIALSQLQTKAFVEAEPLIRESLTIREKKAPDNWATFNTRSLLGGALLGQKKYDQAEPLLLAGYEGLKKHEAKIPPLAKPRLPEAIERLVQLYEALGKMDEAAKWQKELDAVKAAQKQEAKP